MLNSSPDITLFIGLTIYRRNLEDNVQFYVVIAAV